MSESNSIPSTYETEAKKATDYSERIWHESGYFRKTDKNDYTTAMQRNAEIHATLAYGAAIERLAIAIERLSMPNS